ncbi:stage II sporulation protein R [Virgibacillus phasianinus]|uniref:Stage II sporulation protein R n=1 Tax=Virgibacillus phasianinus TaxID=2017483 RepID=A0A220U2K1_9BACI|nr:stage II sporulation protein R [Virgibacillus phasianinus]ASK62071.1 stage II sporulation protein R [Virgibacillus phasianinus]
MKKILFFVLIFFILFLSMPANGASQPTEDKKGYQVIPDEAIRLRILANSDGDRDQEVKRTVRDAVNANISKWVKDISDINEARELIQARLPEIKSIVADTLKEEDKDQTFEVKYGPNVTFPTKLYGNYIYPAGEYEAVLITIGKGKGANWWCVLFPPLCFLDFSNGTSVASAKASAEEPTKQEEEEPVEKKFFLFEWLGLS